MTEFESIEDVAKQIKNTLDSNSDKKKISILYAFNTTGKTRLSNAFIELAEEKVLCYNAFVEDLFNWDNENYVLNFDSNSWLLRLIKEQGIEKNIIENFTRITNSKIEPFFDLNNGEITFNIATGDDSSKSNIKISKGEESIFIWSIFYTILESVIDSLNTKEDERTTQEFNNLEYIIVDDPVSSIDDTKLISMALQLIDIIKSSNNNKLKFLITTHHALFYNVLSNSLKKENKTNKFILTKEGNKLKLDNQYNDTPFGYHFVVKNEIQKAISDNNIKKYHFNLFRTILEKTANFLGYNEWGDCITGDRKSECIRLLNLNSHSKLSDLEYRELSAEDKTLFKKTYSDFIEKFNWKVN